jgi:hypothetical protein
MDPNEAGLRKFIRRVLEEAALDVVEERVISYIVRELHHGRKISAILADPYVRNRVNEERLGEILENPEILKAVEEELDRAFKTWDFEFKE